jgi:hypothetical protein
MPLPAVLALAALLQAPPAVTAAPPAKAPTPAGGAVPAAAPAKAPAPAPATDGVRVVVPDSRADLLKGGTEGRVIVFLLSTDSREGPRPLDAPFFVDPQPMYSVGVARLEAGKPVTVGADAVAWPVPMAELSGRYRVQAVFDRERTQRGHDVPGNLASAEATVDFEPGRTDTVTLELTTALQADPEPSAPNLRFFEMRSPLLSRAAGRDVTMRAGVALPPGWDDPNFRRRMFPAVYVIPGFGGRAEAAAEYARMLAAPGGQAVVPQAVWIVLDPEAPLGHHGFVDSPANGPRGQALVEELIPELERRFRLVRRPEARILTGHSSGGWSSLWLQLRYPGTFGACFSSAPDPVDFRSFQGIDLYRDTSVFSDADGKERPSFRTVLADAFDKVRMTIRQEAGMERVLGPARDSGEQWDAWSAMWSAVDPRTRLPKPMFDDVAGTIDRGTVTADWSRFDIGRLLREDTDRVAPILRTRVRLLCGDRDNFYLDGAVRLLRDDLARIAAGRAAAGKPLPDGPGYVELVPGEDHRTLPASSMLRWQREMRDHLHANGLD